jgi:hypothetical protein
MFGPPRARPFPKADDEDADSHQPILPLRYHRDFPLAHQSISFAPFASSRLITLVLFCSSPLGSDV